MPLPFKLSIGWEEVKEKMRENNADISEEDLYYEPGKEEQLLFRLQQKMNMTREEVIGYVESISCNSDKAG